MFKKGESGKPTGRPTGMPNKVNQEIRERINSFLDENFDTIKSDIQQLESKDRIKFFIDLLQFGLPKLKNIEMDVQNMPNLQIETLNELEIRSAIEAIHSARTNRN